jgi:hypothetical protein
MAEPEPRRILRRPADSPAKPKLTRRYSDNDDDGDDDDEPEKDLTVLRGWAGHRHVKASAPSKYTKFYKTPDQGEGLIMFLEDEPYASFLVHFCDWLRGQGKFSYVCLQKDCPLCEIDDPAMRDRFNVLDCDPSAPVPKLYTFEVGPTIANTIEKYGQDPKTGPLGGSYYGISFTGTKQNKRTLLRPVKKRDLVDDWKFDPLTDEQITKYAKKLATPEDIERSTREELQEIADNAVK